MNWWAVYPLQINLQLKAAPESVDVDNFNQEPWNSRFPLVLNMVEFCRFPDLELFKIEFKATKNNQLYYVYGNLNRNNFCVHFHANPKNEMPRSFLEE